MAAGEEIGIKIDQTLTQDATGTMCMLQLEAMGVERVKPLSVNFVDHSMMQSGFRNPDDHEYLKTVPDVELLSAVRPTLGFGDADVVVVLTASQPVSDRYAKKITEIIRKTVGDDGLTVRVHGVLRAGKTVDTTSPGKKGR